VEVEVEVEVHGWLGWGVVGGVEGASKRSPRFCVCVCVCVCPSEVFGVLV
jgi:hypothetical protein